MSFRVRHGKGPSLLGLLAGIIFIGLGLVVIMPAMGTFGVIWTLVAVGITLYYAVNLFREEGVSVYEIDHERPARVGDDLEARLRRLERLRADGLISQAEYDEKRDEIMREQW